ncbi:MAG: RHS repeat-associated core domain-containing protein, partial [Lachnospiraceae bacterium]|nr:RHS repeat-associated core domain-containing protein [Lachnospiraceae bacterium]
MLAECGNRTKCRINGTDSATCLYDAMNRLTRRAQDGTVYNYAYDKRGNLTEERQDGSLIRQYVYDTANRMVTGKDLLSGAQTDYTYNALNMRIANTLTLPGTEAPQIRTTAYVPDFLSGTDNDLMAYHSGGDVTKAVYGRRFERLGSISAAGQKYEMPDLWGSPMYTADAQGNAEWRAGHDIWGRPSAAETDADKRFTNYLYDPVIGKYFAQARFYDSGQGRMLSPDPIKRRINPYPYCDNDPVNYNDPTGEIPSILAAGFIGGMIGGASGFIGSAASQLTGGGKFNWKKAIGSAANGAVVGAAKGALIGSGAGIPFAFATDFAAGSVGNALEQGLTTGKVN